VFLTGYIAGVHFVQTLAKVVAGEVLPRIVTVGRTSEGETEVLAHGDLEDAFDHVVIYLYPYAVVTTVEGDLYRWYVCRPDVPDDMVATIDMRGVFANSTVSTSLPMIRSDTGDCEPREHFDGVTFFEGFAAGLDAEEHAFAISFGTLDVMANLLIEQPVLAKELR
jgi:hypothetical protein